MVKTQEKVMAPRKTTTGTERSASRKTQETAGDQAGLAALTSTLLAGAVTGAVAGMIEDADTRNARHESMQPSPDELAGHNDRVEPDQSHSFEEPANGIGAVAAVEPAETAKAETPQATEIGPQAASHARDASHELLADAGSRAPAADPAGPASSTGNAISSTAQTPVTEMPPQPGAAAAAAGGLAEAHRDIVSGIDAVGVDQTAGLVDGMAARLDQAIAGVSEGLAESFAAIDASQADIARTLDGVFETVTVTIDAAVAQIDGQVSRAIDEIGISLADAVAGTPVALIPASVLGAEQDDRPPDGFLAKLFDTATAEPTSEAASAHRHDAIDTVQSPASSHSHSPIIPGDFLVPELTGAIDAVKIGFAGQPYSEFSDTHDGPAGPHANLLHGLM